ncbi:DUF3138 family protein [Derxia gummosa]|uniref:DUF3138 family protein n=1 Tax=Derxia gummosa DSM 723 TaxID=1121388 RepID=A0A8B6X828_9BURK|nr:DUF3138 family protein [Derxia gummosa]
MSRLNPVALALRAGAIALPLALASLPVHAQSSPDLLKEIQALKARLEQLEKQVADQKAEIETAKAAPKVDPVEFNRIALKTEAMEDANADSGFKGLKVSGFIDPTYIYNRNTHTSGFNFLNNFDYRDDNSGYTYDNSYFGMAVLDFQKEMEDGTLLRLTLAPHKSTGSGFNLNSIVHEASASVPLGNNLNLIAGALPDWSGYEAFLPNENKFITHNLLFDFAAFTYYTGAGLETSWGKWSGKAMVANLNTARSATGNKSPMLTYRADYEISEFSGFGFAGQHGRYLGNGLNMFEVDGFFTRGDLDIKGQIGGGEWQHNAFNGRMAQWWGASLFASYQLTPKWELLGRADYLNNRRNGGGTIGVVSPGNDCELNGIDDGSCSAAAIADGLNGFGPGMGYDSSFGRWTATNPDKGANRWALSVGAGYLFSDNVRFKLEYRYDRANLPVFIDSRDGSYGKDNHLLGASSVISF